MRQLLSREFVILHCVSSNYNFAGCYGFEDRQDGDGFVVPANGSSCSPTAQKKLIKKGPPKKMSRSPTA